MSVLILGGDKISPLETMLRDFGVERIIHWTARNQKRGRKQDKPIPVDVNVVVMLTNFLNHNAMKHYRAEAKSKDIPIVYSTRNVECLKQEFIGVLNRLDRESEICKECEHYLRCYERSK
ncbi:MAG: DUF2325 domain-containing protein [Campylobacterales bacterium]|jgi:hypothetical protein|uniref:DUF2325 domain-containing protein n=1 Tax=Sulfurovum sp. TaxID=1969726 RepID=UPI0019833934|nr:DUF2325 domain-containing protein [Sulfurovum sp.]MBD3790762.1 DUF2325 domain-containing protein [Campylobacterales bacterium]MDY0403460.1 DUF2325 domain-containing protein [Sulfurovum sp.]